jgi:hypothetical protein
MFIEFDDFDCVTACFAPATVEDVLLEMDTKPVISAALRAWANELGATPAQLAPVRPEHAHYRNRAGLLDALISELRHRIALSKSELYSRQGLLVGIG